MSLKLRALGGNMHQVQSLEGEMRQTLVSMTLLQYGRTQAFASSSGDTERDPRPAGESHPLAEKWLAEWLADPSEDTLLMARAELDAWKRSVPRDEDHEYDLEQWVVDDGEGYAVAQVAGKFGIAESRVRRIRLKKGRESEFGLPHAFAQHAAAPRDERVAYLSDRGCSWREIAAQTGLHKTQVQRILAKQRQKAA